MTDRQISLAIPIILLIFAAVFAALARHSSYKVGGGYFNLRTNLYIPVIFIIASIWSIMLTAKSSLSPILKLLAVILILLAIALLGFTLYKEIHPVVVGK